MRLSSLLVTVLLALVAVPGAPAQEEVAGRATAGGRPAAAVPGRGGPPAMPDLLLHFHTSHRFGFEADFEDRQGGYSVYVATLGLGATRRVTPEGSLTLNLKREHHHYEFDAGTNLVPGTDEPFDTLHKTSLGLNYRHLFSPEWGGMASVSASSSMEEGASLEDSIEWFAMVGARYQWTRTFAISFALVGATILEEDPILFPVVLAEWQITERLRLTTNRTVRLTCDLGEGWNTHLSLGYDSAHFRLDDRGPLPDGVVRTQRGVARLGGGWGSRNRALRVEAFVGAALGQEMTFNNSRGRRRYRDEVETGLEVGLTVRLTF